MVIDLYKSKGSVANCVTDRASVHTGNAKEQFRQIYSCLHCTGATFKAEQKTYPVQCEHSLKCVQRQLDIVGNYINTWTNSLCDICKEGQVNLSYSACHVKR